MSVKRKCNFCDKVVEGLSQQQLDFLFRCHMTMKHPGRIKIQFEEGGKFI